MIAKIIASAPTRTDALERLAQALDETRVIGPRTNALFLAALLRTRGFRTGKFDTGFIEANLATLVPPHEPDLAAAAAGLARLIDARAGSHCGAHARRRADFSVGCT